MWSIRMLAEALNLIGTINCDEFGDCGAARITVVHNIGGEDNAEASMDNVVFSFAP